MADYDIELEIGESTIISRSQADWNDDDVLSTSHILNRPFKTIDANTLTVNDNDELTIESVASERVEYENADHPDIANVEEALDKIIEKLYYVEPSIDSFTADKALDNEIGTVINSITFNWVLNKQISSQSLTGILNLESTDRTATYSTPLSTNKTFTLSVTDGQNTASASKAYRFMPKVYCGVAGIATYDSAFVVALGGTLKTSKVGTYTKNVGANEYMYIACPTSYGKPSVVKIGGFDTELTDCGTISVTNESGYTQNYYLMRTPHDDTGSTTMVIS